MTCTVEVALVSGVVFRGDECDDWRDCVRSSMSTGIFSKTDTPGACSQ